MSSVCRHAPLLLRPPDLFCLGASPFSLYHLLNAESLSFEMLQTNFCTLSLYSSKLTCTSKFYNLCSLFYGAMLCIARTMLSQDIQGCLSVCICPSHAAIVLKQLNISSNFFHHCTQIISFSIPNGMAIFQRGTSHP